MLLAHPFSRLAESSHPPAQPRWGRTVPPSPVLCLEVTLHKALPMGLPAGRWGPAGIHDPVLASLWGQETSEQGAEVTPTTEGLGTRPSEPTPALVSLWHPSRGKAGHSAREAAASAISRGCQNRLWEARTCTQDAQEEPGPLLCSTGNGDTGT